MPSAVLHMDTAEKTLAVLPSGALDNPAFYLGSIAADARLVTNQPRGVTHLWSTADDVSGAIRLPAMHPHLAANHLSDAERAFVAGYLCHLVADEQWTLVIYRRYFGRNTIYGGGREGAELQLALGAELDAEIEARPEGTHRFMDALRKASILQLRDDLLPFLPMRDVQHWREAVLAQAMLLPGEARYAFVDRLIRTERQPLAERQAMADGTAAVPTSSTGQSDNSVIESASAGTARIAHDAHAAPDSTLSERDAGARIAFYQALPALRTRAAVYVTRESLDEFHARAVAESAAALSSYLAGQPIQPPLGTQAPSATSSS